MKHLKYFVLNRLLVIASSIHQRWIQYQNTYALYCVLNFCFVFVSYYVRGLGIIYGRSKWLYIPCLPHRPIKVLIASKSVAHDRSTVYPRFVELS